MSQSDYIKYKKIRNVLSINKNEKAINLQNVVVSENNKKKRYSLYFNQSPVFESHDYQDYNQYTLENTVQNTKPVLNRLTNSGKQVVWNMDKADKDTVINCSPFIVCKGTHARSNRIPMLQSYFVPVPQPLNIEQTKNARNQKKACICALDKSYTQENLCKCKTRFFGVVR